MINPFDEDSAPVDLAKRIEALKSHIKGLEAARIEILESPDQHTAQLLQLNGTALAEARIQLEECRVQLEGRN